MSLLPGNRFFQYLVVPKLKYQFYQEMETMNYNLES